jgi:hypothetical protein
MNIATKTLLALLASSLVSNALAEQSEEILKVKKSTFVNLVDLLVQRGVINKQEGSGLVTAAEQEAATEEHATHHSKSAHAAETELQSAEIIAGTAVGKSGSQSKHVSYVPEFVKKEIRDEVRAELKAEVIKDVKQDAKKEGWGIPGALPEWVASITPSFDIRLRFAEELYGNDNQQVYGVGPNSGPYDWLAINNDGGMQNAQNKNQLFLNNQKDRLRIRERFRFGFDAKIANGLQAGVRLATSNMYNPVSNDQTLGNTGASWQVAIDRAYLQYDFVDSKGTDWFTLLGGRTINPFVSTDIVFDPDLSFEGVTGSFRYHFNQDDPKLQHYRTPISTGRNGINQGLQTPDSVFLTMGVYPIQSVNFSAVNKWLYAGQFGADWLVFDETRFNVASSYYEYQNITARYNTASGNGYANDWTAPQFVQKGNSMAAITDQYSGQGQVCQDTLGGCLFGLASGFKIFNTTAMFDYTGFDFAHVMFTADYAKNLGFNQQQILSEFHQDITPRTNAYQTRVDVGMAEIRRFADWSVSLAYRYVQRDAVLDAFTDSIFHQGGTNAKGWVLGTQYGLAKNTWLNLRWLSTDAIDGPNYSVDTVNLDLNARF